MGRKKGDKTGGDKSSAPKQTLEGLSDDQRYSLVEQHKQKYERLLAAQKAANKAVQDIGKIIKADLGPDGMSEIKALIEGGTTEGEATIKARIERDARVLRWLGVPIGTQTDFFPDTDRTPLTERAFNEGKRQGLAGETQSNPHHHATEAHRFHNDGYAAGQQTLATKGFSKLDEETEGSFVDKMRAQNDKVEDDIKKTAADLNAAANLGSSRPTFTVAN